MLTCFYRSPSVHSWPSQKSTAKPPLNTLLWIHCVLNIKKPLPDVTLVIPWCMILTTLASLQLFQTVLPHNYLDRVLLLRILSLQSFHMNLNHILSFPLKCHPLRKVYLCVSLSDCHQNLILFSHWVWFPSTEIRIIQLSGFFYIFTIRK